jgi:hypothetical protein
MVVYQRELFAIHYNNPSLLYVFIHTLFDQICKHWDDCVFNSVTPCVSAVVWPVEEEELLWCAAGAHHLYQLL